MNLHRLEQEISYVALFHELLLSTWEVFGMGRGAPWSTHHPFDSTNRGAMPDWNCLHEAIRSNSPISFGAFYYHVRGV